ncbi:MAG: glucose-6-phosphate isomerase [Candidatus Aminicenantes bacterium]|nr:glucose-6-phosphate isomerase [Candidatus Aminicenantes bacterium]
MEAANLRAYQKDIGKALAALSKEKIIERIWKKDWTVWKSEPEEIADRLGWLDSPLEAWKRFPEIEGFVQEVRRDRFTDALLLGMGGSSLAPLVLGSIFRTKKGFLNLAVLDSTVPAAVLEVSRKLDPARTLFIVSSKSGTTVETASLFKYFWNWTARFVGEERTGRHFVAITDPGTPLAQDARRLRFRSVFAGDPDIGGRFSALSPFGLVPGSLKGLDLSRFLGLAREMALGCREAENLRANPGAFLGACLGVMASKGRDKITFLLPPRLRAFGLWLEQLIAESTGKEGKGIVPVEGEPPGPPGVYGRDRFFVHVGLGADALLEAAVRRLKSAGFPVLSRSLPGAVHLGGQFFLWEFATAVAGYFLGVNPFDQPDVDLTKKKTQVFLDVYREKGSLPEEKACLEEDGVSLFSESRVSTLAEGLQRHLDRARPGDYIGIQAFLAPGISTTRALQKLRIFLRDKTGLAVTPGYGPRFLHSTGQLHKGDRGRGLFIQITAETPEDVPVPEAPGSRRSLLTFGALSAAQARGDAEALKSSGRRLIRLHFGAEIKKGLDKILLIAQGSPSSPAKKRQG